MFCGGWNFSKSVSLGPTFIREMRVDALSIYLHQFSSDKIFTILFQLICHFSSTKNMILDICVKKGLGGSIKAIIYPL